MKKYCPSCDKKLETRYFTKSKSRKDGLQAYCSDCMKKYRRKHYNNNKDVYINRALANKKRLTAYLKELKSGPCADCGVIYPHYVMDFDHLGDKKFLVSRLVAYGSVDLIDKEVSKCDLVCSNCHRERTHQRSLV